MTKKYLAALLILLPGIASAQLRTGSAVLYIGTNSSVTVLGRITLSSDVTGPGSLVLGGTTLQDIDAAGVNIPNMVVKNAANISMLSNAVVTNSLTFTKGNIFTNNQLLTLLPPAIVQGYSGTQFICTGDSAGNAATLGGFQLTIPAGGGVLSPVGPNINSYNPVTIKNTAGPAEQYTIRVAPVPVGGAAAGNTLNTTWSITEATAGGNTINLTLQWNGASEPAGFNRASARIVRSNGASILTKTIFLSALGSDPYTLNGGAFPGAGLFGITSDINALAAIVTNNKPDASSLAAAETISMYPTIVKTSANLVIKTPAEKRYVYIITDMNGKTIAKRDIIIWKGDNIVPVTLPNLASGIYILNVYDGNILKKSIKFVKG